MTSISLKKLSKSSVSIVILLIVFTISAKPLMAYNNGRSYLLLSYGFIFIVFNIRYLASVYVFKNFKEIYIFAFFLITSSLLNYELIKLLSLFYTFFLITIYCIFIKLIRFNNFSIFTYIKIIKILLFSFFVVLLIQQIMTIMNISPVFNELGSIGWKLNSLSTEPSLAGTSVSILFFSLLKCREFLNQRKVTFSFLIKNDLLSLFSYLYLIITCGSSFGILFVVIIFSYFIRKNNLFWILLSILFMGVLLSSFNFPPMIRLKDFILSIFSLDQSNILKQDLSAGIRFVPLLQFITEMDIFDLQFWFGKGMYYSSIQLNEFLGFDKRVNIGWFLPSYIVDQGVLPFIYLMWFISKNAFFKLYNIETLIFIITLTNTNINTQTFWVAVIFFTINKFFHSKYKIYKNSDIDFKLIHSKI